MTDKLRRRLQKLWHIIRRRRGARNGGPLRLVIEKAKWLNDTRSPVMLMVDDLTNAWHNRLGNDRWERGGDWGGGLRKPGSAMRFLEDNLLRDFPEVKVTFFVVAGRISHYTQGRPFVFAEPLNFAEESKTFFRALDDDQRFEIAFHGYDHGTPGTTTEDFMQEWKGFRSVEEACAQIEKGKAIFKDVFDKYPSGGKYGGWEYNEHGDESIDRTGFLWWCRDWMPKDVKGRIPDSYYEPQLFGQNLVVALTSTVHGFFWSRKQIDTLLRKKQIISIEEHIAAVRPDGHIQTPNIRDDMDELRRLFIYLKDKNVWYATGSQVAEYFIGYACSLIYDIKAHSFKIRYFGRVEKPILTLKIDCSSICSPEKPYVRLTDPNSVQVPPENIKFDLIRYIHGVNIPVLEGEYFVEEAAEPTSK